VPARRAHRAPDHDVRLARLREWLNTGMWFLPMVWAFGAMAAALVVVELDRHLGGDRPTWLVFGRGPDSARQVLAAVAASTIAFTGTVFSITIVALQLASTQFSPRVLRTFLRDRPSQHCFGTFVATALYSLIVLREVGTTDDAVAVPGLAVSGAFLLVVASVFAFVFLVHHVAQSIRAVSIMDAVAAEARASIEANHPPAAAPGTPDDDADPAGAAPAVPAGDAALTEAAQVIVAPGPGALLGIDEDDLVAVAARHDCVLEVALRVGDSVVTGMPVVRVHGAAATVPPAAVLAHLGVGPERTLYQDTAFGFRQLVDMAEKALSPAVNDPTTAVQALDRIHDLLRRLVARPDPEGRYRDDTGALRLVVPQVTWEDHLRLGCSEVRQFGAGSIQIARRLRALLLDLREAAPAGRRSAVEAELGALDRAVARAYVDEHDRALALEPDLQGLR
jgi:uncharacterized membrane protein